MSRRRLKRLMIKCCILVIAVTIYGNWNSFLLILSVFFELQEENFQWRDQSPSEVSENSLSHGVQKISSILDEMPILYPSKILTYTGWIQNLDVLYDSNQWNQKPLVVHVVPFSHNDPGWLSTYEEYFSSRTRHILDVAIFKLNLNSNMTFVWSEICYLKRWYEMISDADKKIFRRLLKEGRFEVLTGGMVMPDEAIVSYYAFINVLTQGHLWLKKEFNYSVQTAWSLDSFGHSSTYAHMLRLSGIEKTFIQRTHYALKRHLALKKQVEFYWVQPWEIDKQMTGLFTHMSPFLFYSLLYSCGPKIQVCCQFVFSGKKCWKRGKYAPADKITTDNLREKSLALLDMLRKKAQFVSHDNVLLLVGDDFSFYTIYTWDVQWDNMQKIFNYLNADPNFKIQIKYSTIGSYLEAAESEIEANKKKVPRFEGDFFPYSDRGDQYWSGYYSTRPKLKSLIRTSQSDLRNAEILFGVISSQHLSNQFPLLSDAVLQCQEELGRLQDDFSIYQHHDTITGTSRLEVIRDTEYKLFKFRESVGGFVDKSVKLLQPPIDDKKFFNLVKRKSGLFDDKQDDVLHVPQKILVFNSLTSKGFEVLKLYVQKDSIRVYDEFQKPLACQTSPALHKNMSFVARTFEVFIKVLLEPLGMHEISLVDAAHDEEGCVRSNVLTILNSSWFSEHQKSFVLSNPFIEVHFEGGVMKKVLQKSTKKMYDLQTTFLAYSSIPNLNPFQDKSGAYIFLPPGKPQKVEINVQRAVLVEGDLKSFLVAELSPEVVQITEIFHCYGPQEKSIFLTNIVDISRKGNYEISMVLETSALDNDRFFTDLNGYQIIKRKWRSKFGIQGNFYPMTNLAFIEDVKTRLSLASGQCHGVTGAKKGQIEVMLDRRLLQDDWRGLNENVTDNVAVASTFAISLETVRRRGPLESNVPKPSALALHNTLRLNNPLLVLEEPSSNLTLKLLGASVELPCGVFLVSWRMLTTNASKQEFRITLHYYGLEPNIYDGKEPQDCFSETVTLHASLFLNGYMEVELYEMNLTGSQIKARIYSNFLKISPMELKTWLFIVWT